MKDAYSILGRDYDLLCPKEEIFKQKSFFQTLARKYAITSVLDCACGTGWHLSMLKNMGLDCSGSDLSPDMLRKAKKNLKGKNIPLKCADFRTLSSVWDKKFDLIICMTTSLPHMLSDQDVVTALRSMRKQLNKGGVLVIDSGISDRLLTEKPTFTPARIGNKTAFYFFLQYPSRRKIVFNILEVVKTKNGFRHAYDAMEYNAIRRNALARDLAQAGFRNVRYYGDFAFSAYSPRESSRLIAVARG